MIFNTVLYNKKVNSVALSVTENGEYLPSDLSADFFSNVKVDVKKYTLNKGIVKQYGNYISVEHTNGVSANTFDYYVDGNLKCSSTKAIISLTEVLGESESGTVSVELKNSSGECMSSGISDGVEVTLKNYTDCTVTLSNGVVSVSGIDDISSEVHIPPYTLINDVLYPVTAIAKGAFDGKDGITSVRGDNIKTIYSKAFNGVSTLTSVTFPKLSEINGVDIFRGTALVELDLEDVKILNAKRLLAENTVPCYVKMPSDTKFNSIVSDTFSNANLGQLLIHKNVDCIDSLAFENAVCKYLEIGFWNVQTATDAFKNADFLGSEGMIIFNYDSIYKRYHYQDAVNVGFVLTLAKGDTFLGSLDVSGKTVKFEIYKTLDNAFNRVDALSVSGGSYTADRSGKYYIRIAS